MAFYINQTCVIYIINAIYNNKKKVSNINNNGNR